MNINEKCNISRGTPTHTARAGASRDARNFDCLTFASLGLGSVTMMVAWSYWSGVSLREP